MDKSKFDDGQKATDAIVTKLEKRINKEYADAITEIEGELADYFRRYKIKDETWNKWVEEGSKTEAEYKQWRTGQWAVGRRWQNQIDVIAHQLASVNSKCNTLSRSAAPEIYADNFNFATYQVEKDAQINTAFTLYSAESVERLVKEDPDVLPPAGRKVSKAIAEGKAVKWNKQQLQSVMMQGIMQGDSIPKLAERLANTVGDRDRKASIRNARTMATGAQNAGRVQAYKRAQDKGVDLEQMWIATLDGRTRHTHRWIDGEVRPVGEDFSNGCEYPGDPKGDPAEIYNCRCSLRGVVKGLERRAYQYKDTSGMDGMSYDEWRNAKSKSNPIDLPAKKGAAIRAAEASKYSKKPDMPNTITHTPEKPTKFDAGSYDATKEWLSEAVPNSHAVEIVTRFMQDGIEYDTSMNGVTENHGEEERAMAELIKNKRGGIIKIMPEVSGDYKNVRTPDFLIDGDRYDLKTMRDGTSKRAVQNNVNPNQNQAENFILDITDHNLGRDELIRQSEEIFNLGHSAGVQTIVLVENSEIIKVFKRK